MPHQIPAPSAVNATNRPRPCGVMPAGIEIRWRMTGSSRPTNVLISPWRRKNASVRSSERSRHEHVFAVAAEDRLAHEHREHVVHQRAEHAPQRARQDRRESALIWPLAARYPAGGMTSSLGSGSTDDSIAMRSTMPG